MKKQLAIAFALGVLVGVLLWSLGDDGEETPPAAKKPSVTSKTQTRAPAPFQSAPYPRQEPGPRGQDYRFRYGGPPGSVSQWAPGGQPYDSPVQAMTTPPYPGSGGPYDSPYGYSSPSPAPGYRFRPTDGDSGAAARYSGSYTSPAPSPYPAPPPSRGERPPYPQSQPGNFGTPGYDDRLPYSQQPASDLYSVR